MARVAFLFPGQGAQQVGMADSWLTQYEFAGQWLEQLSGWVPTLPGQPSFVDALIKGPEEALRQTSYTQPAILFTSLVAWRAFAQQSEGLCPVAVAGHSLGEFGALVAGGALTADDALRLVVARAQLMQNSPPGAMSVILGLSAERVQAIIAEQQSNLPPEETLVLANDNAADQVVIAGSALALAQAESVFKAGGAKRVIALPVGGAFHSPLMQSAAEAFALQLDAIPFGDVNTAVASNVDGQFVRDKTVLHHNLRRQMASAVQWRTTMTHLVEQAQVDAVIEFGPGKVLTGLMKKAAPSVQGFNLNTPDQLGEIVHWWQSSVAVTV